MISMYLFLSVLRSKGFEFFWDVEKVNVEFVWYCLSWGRCNMSIFWSLMWMGMSVCCVWCDL